MRWNGSKQVLRCVYKWLQDVGRQLVQQPYKTDLSFRPWENGSTWKVSKGLKEEAMHWDMTFQKCIFNLTFILMWQHMFWGRKRVCFKYLFICIHLFIFKLVSYAHHNTVVKKVILKWQFKCFLLCNIFKCCHMTLQKLFKYTNLLLKKHFLSMLKMVVLLNILWKLWYIVFFRINLMRPWIKGIKVFISFKMSVIIYSPCQSNLYDFHSSKEDVLKCFSVSVHSKEVSGVQCCLDPNLFQNILFCVLQIVIQFWKDMTVFIFLGKLTP